MITFNIITLFPNLFIEHFNNRPFKPAIERGLIKVNLINLRDFALDKYGTVDDKPYGGGVGMVLMAEPIYKALCHIYGKDFARNPLKNNKIILLSPKGTVWTQNAARDFSKSAANEDTTVTLINGRYEGVDQRVEDLFCTHTISVGEYILSGGELASLVVMESITRLIPGVLEKEEATEKESFSARGGAKLEHPQYTRPEEFMGKKVPEVLLSGNHKLIDEWKSKN